MRPEGEMLIHGSRTVSKQSDVNVSRFPRRKSPGMAVKYTG